MCVSQVAFGDLGLSYKFSGNTVPAKAWPSALLYVRDMLTRLTGYCFNFVLVNRLVLLFHEVLWYNYSLI